MSIQIYKVAGAVRDDILGLRSKDIDCAVEAPSFEAMEAYIVERGKIYLSRPEFFTIRAKLGGEDMDFVLCRKESGYSDGRRPDSVEMGTIYDDLARRDFTMNAIARREPDGLYIDPHGGADDIVAGLIRTVGAAVDRFNKDALRPLRAMRFSITMGFDLHDDVRACLGQLDLLGKLRSVSVERQQIELQKCFLADTPATLAFLERYGHLRNYLFDNSGIRWQMHQNRHLLQRFIPPYRQDMVASWGGPKLFSKSAGRGCGDPSPLPTWLSGLRACLATLAHGRHGSILS